MEYCTRSVLNRISWKKFIYEKHTNRYTESSSHSFFHYFWISKYNDENDFLYISFWFSFVDIFRNISYRKWHVRHFQKFFWSDRIIASKEIFKFGSTNFFLYYSRSNDWKSSIRCNVNNEHFPIENGINWMNAKCCLRNTNLKISLRGYC